MKKCVSRTLQMLSTILVLIVASLNPLHASYNGECWVVSGGDTVYKLNADGLADPTIIPGLTQAQAAVVDPQSGIVWIAVSAANAVYRFDPAEPDPNQQFITLPPIERPHAVSINPTDGTVWIGGINTVQKFSADGTQILASITGVHEPEVAVNTTDGSCWVTDSRGTIARYSAAGAVAATSPVKLKEPKYVAVNSQSGNAWVTDPHAGIIVKLNPSGQEVLRITDLKLPGSPSVDQRSGNLWVVADSSTLVKLSADGQKLMEIPAGMVILSISVYSQDGSVWVADQFGSTFQGGVSKFSADGQQLFENPVPQPSFVSVGNWMGQ
jgi:DNA-binding beta-propeller fold protein YncE